MKIKYGVVYSDCIFIMHCYNMYALCLIPLQVMPRPGSSQVSSAAASDVEMEGSIEQQKDSNSAGQHSNTIDEIGREVKRCIEVNIEVLQAVFSSPLPPQRIPLPPLPSPLQLLWYQTLVLPCPSLLLHHLTLPVSLW